MSALRQVIIVGKYKLYNASGPYGVLLPDGSMTEDHACFPGEIYPNGTSPPGGEGAPPEGRNCNRTDLRHVPSCQPGYGQCEQKQTCPNGACLYDIFADVSSLSLSLFLPPPPPPPSLHLPAAV